MFVVGSLSGGVMKLPQPCQSILDEINILWEDHLIRSYPPPRNLTLEQFENVGPLTISREGDAMFRKHQQAVEELDKKVHEADQRLHDCIIQHNQPK